MGVRGSKIALLFQYNKGNGNTIFLFLSKVTLQANGVNKVWPEHKALLKGLELPQEKAWKSGRTEWQDATPQVDSQVSSAALHSRNLLSLLQLPGHVVAPSLSHAKPHLSSTVPLLAVDSEDTFKLFSCGE